MKKIIKAVLLLCVTGLGFWLWQIVKSRGAQNDPIPVEKAELRDIDFTLRISGEVAPATEIEIKPEVGGRVKALHVAAGDKVTRGQLLVEIDDNDLRIEQAAAETEIEGARLRVDLARRNFQRSKELFDSNLISQEIFDNMQSELDIALNNLTKAERSLQTVEERISKTRLLAPTDGTVLDVRVIEGQVVVAAASVNNGTTLMTVADLSRLVINSHVNQIDIAHVKPGQTITFGAETYPDMRSEATIDFIAPMATIVKAVKGFAVEALVREPDPRLRPGMTVSLEVPVACATNAVSIPISAIFTDENNEKVVYVRQGSGSVKRRVQVGITDFFHAEIVSGLEPGEEILLAPPPEPQSA